jgi:hypothetical protein
VKESRKEARGGELARYTVERGDQVGSEGEGANLGEGRGGRALIVSWNGAVAAQNSRRVVRLVGGNQAVFSRPAVVPSFRRFEQKLHSREGVSRTRSRVSQVTEFSD